MPSDNYYFYRFRGIESSVLFPLPEDSMALNLSTCPNANVNVFSLSQNICLVRPRCLCPCLVYCPLAPVTAECVGTEEEGARDPGPGAGCVRACSG